MIGQGDTIVGEGIVLYKILFYLLRFYSINFQFIRKLFYFQHARHCQIRRRSGRLKIILRVALQERGR